jgi:hydrogenase assembly chaperone HypC/HupF
MPRHAIPGGTNVMSPGVGADTPRDAYPEPSIDTGAADSGHCHPIDGEDACITCGDTAVPLEVIAIDEPRALALCKDDQGHRETVETALVQPVALGDQLLVHAGTAIAHLDSDAPPRVPGREAEDTRDISAEPHIPASPQGEARGDAVVEGSA